MADEQAIAIPINVEGPAGEPEWGGKTPTGARRGSLDCNLDGNRRLR